MLRIAYDISQLLKSAFAFVYFLFYNVVYVMGLLSLGFSFSIKTLALPLPRDLRGRPGFKFDYGFMLSSGIFYFIFCSCLFLLC